MNSLPKISVITPTYNQGNFIEGTINSVINQNYPNLEYIVLDGGSTDGILEILEKYNKHLIWKSEKDNGQSDAINKGFQRASGDIFSFINSDDTYEPGALLKVGEYFSTNPYAKWVTGYCRVINENDKEIRRFITLYKNFWLNCHSYSSLLLLNYISQPATFWRKNLVKSVGSFNESLHYSMDYDFSLRVGQKHQLYLIQDYLANFRIHKSAKSRLEREYFNEDYKVASEYAVNKFQTVIHKFHNELIVFIYRLLK